MVGLAIIAALWLLVVPILALIFAAQARGRSRILTERLEAAERRLALVDAALAQRSRAAPPEREPAAEVPSPEAAKTPAAATVAEETAAPWASTAQAPPSTAPPAAARRRESLESRIGARWSVLVGGLALALGAIFLVRYSIEQGLITEGMRIALGFALSAMLFAAGEYLRRRDRADSVPPAGADVPAVLTAAGGVAAFATVYAAYALYGFIGNTAAFVLLTAAGMVTLALSVIHGPSLAALGALGSYVAPLLVSSDQPLPMPLVLHNLAVTAAVLGIARIRGWAWLATAGMAGALGWGVLNGFFIGPETTAAEIVMTAGLAVSAMGILLAAREAHRLCDRAQDFVALGALAGVGALSLFYGWTNPDYPALASGIALTGLLGAGASRWPSIGGAALLAGALAVATVMLIEPPAVTAGLPVIELGALRWHVLGAEGLPGFALKAIAIGLLVGIGGFLSAARFAALAPRTAGFFAAASAGAPFAMLVVTYLRHVPFETRPAFGVAALIMAAIFAAATERLIGRRPADPAAPAPALYAAGAVLALSAAIAVGLDTALIPLAFSLGALGVVFVALFRPVAVLPWLAAMLAALLCVALIRNPQLSIEAIGPRPFLNSLITRFGLPAAFVLIAGEILRRRGGGIPAAILQSVGLALLGLFVVLEIRHFAHGGVIVAGPPGLGEQSAMTLAALAFAIGLQKISEQTQSRVYREAALIAGLCGAVAIVMAHLLAVNPLHTGESVGANPVLNLLLPGYLFPAIAAGWLAIAGRRSRPFWYSASIAALAVALGFAYVSLMVRHAFHGPVLAGGGVTDAENWTYSAVWLAFGIALLAAGLVLNSVTARAASGIVIAAVVCKVFLLDMANLTGALRAASFLGLGVVLIVIGRIYQRLLARPRAEQTAP